MRKITRETKIRFSLPSLANPSPEIDTDSKDKFITMLQSEVNEVCSFAQTVFYEEHPGIDFSLSCELFGYTPYSDSITCEVLLNIFIEDITAKKLNFLKLKNYQTYDLIKSDRALIYYVIEDLIMEIVDGYKGTGDCYNFAIMYV